MNNRTLCILQLRQELRDPLRTRSSSVPRKLTMPEVSRCRKIFRRPWPPGFVTDSGLHSNSRPSTRRSIFWLSSCQDEISQLMNGAAIRRQCMADLRRGLAHCEGAIHTVHSELSRNVENSLAFGVSLLPSRTRTFNFVSPFRHHDLFSYALTLIFRHRGSRSRWTCISAEVQCN